MKYVPIPEPIQLIEPTSGEPLKDLLEDPSHCAKCNAQIRAFEPSTPVSMTRYLQQYVLNDPRFVSGADGKGDIQRILRGTRIARAFDEYGRLDKAERKGYVALEEDDYRLLREVIEEPKITIAPQLLFQLSPFMVAIVEHASDRKPNSQAQPKKRGGNGKADQPRA